MPEMPEAGSAWPSPDWFYAYEQYAVNDARYSGDQQALQRAYARFDGGGKNRGDSDAYHYNKGDGTKRTGGLKGFFYRFFNGRPIVADEARTRILSPAAYNLANLSSDLLTAEPPTFRLVDQNGKAVKSPAQDRIDTILNGKSTRRTLSHAAELAAGLGAVVLTAHWDPAKTDAPWLEATACDAAIPEFIGGKLEAVNLYTMHYDVNKAGVISDAYIHIERHEAARVIHGLYKITVSTTMYDKNSFGFDTLGELVPLGTLPATEAIPLIPGSVAGPLNNTIALPTGIDLLTASWWRNRPTKIFRKYGDLSMLGRSDFEGEGEMWLDAIDEVWSSWLRDIKLAKARLIVPEQFLELQGNGTGGGYTPSFDEEREILQPLNFLTLKDNETITAQQFAIRAVEHQQTLTALTRELTQFAGYSMSTYGDEAGASKTATEVVDRTTLTERTRDKKALYMFEALDPIAKALLALDKAHYRGPGLAVDADLDIEIPDLSQIDPEKEARTLQYLRAAQAISVRTSVDAQHPEWEQTEKDEEVARILAENNLSETPVSLDAATADRVPAGAQLDANGDPIVEMPQIDGSAGPQPANSTTQPQQALPSPKQTPSGQPAR